MAWEAPLELGPSTRHLCEVWSDPSPIFRDAFLFLFYDIFTQTHHLGSMGPITLFLWPQGWGIRVEWLAGQSVGGKYLCRIAALWVKQDARLYRTCTLTHTHTHTNAGTQSNALGTLENVLTRTRPCNFKCPLLKTRWPTTSFHWAQMNYLKWSLCVYFNFKVFQKWSAFNLYFVSCS